MTHDTPPTIDAPERREVLKPCPNPWCSSHQPNAMGQPFIERLRAADRYRVACPFCPIKGPLGEHKGGAIAAWNGRPDPERQEVSLERAFEIRDAMIQVARNRAGVDGATQSEMREAQGEWLHGVLNDILAASSGERGEALRMVEAVQGVLLWRVGELPDKGYIRDNDPSRRAIGEMVKALTELRGALATPATVEEPKV